MNCYLGFMKRWLVRIYCVRTEYCDKESWRLLHDNARAHRSTLIADFLTKNGILTINNHSSYSPYLAPFDSYLFGKLHLAMKGKRYTNIEDIQRLTTAILNIITSDEIKMSSNLLLDRAKQCIES